MIRTSLVEDALLLGLFFLLLLGPAWGVSAGRADQVAVFGVT